MGPVQQSLVLCSLTGSAQGSCWFNFGLLWAGVSSTARVTLSPGWCLGSSGPWVPTRLVYWEAAGGHKLWVLSR